MRNSELLHVLGGGYWQLPTVRLAKQLGYRVLVTDIYAERPAYALADLHEVVDITDREATLEVARRHRIGGIICDTTDTGVHTAAYVAEELGLPGIGVETALNCTRKDRMRLRAQEAGCRVPRWTTATSLNELMTRGYDLEFPLMVKSVDSQSGRGVSKVMNPAGLADAFDYAKRVTRQSHVLIESCLEGIEAIVDGFVVDGMPTVLAVADKTPYHDNPTIAARITYPGRFSALTLKWIEDENRRVLGALGLANGVFHAEYLIHGSDVYAIDIAARGGGVMIYTHAVPFVSGVDVHRAQLDFVAGIPVRVLPAAVKRAANIEFFRIPEGKLIRIEGADVAACSPGIIALHINVAPGGTVGGLQQKDDRPGFLVGTGNTASEAIAASISAKAALRVVMDGDEHAVPVA